MHHLMHLIQPRSACTNMRTGAAVCQRPRCLARVQAGGTQGTPQLLSPPTGTRRARQRLVGAVPFGKWPIAGLRRAGATAPAVFEGAINGRSALSCSRASVGRNDGRGVRWRSDEGEVLEEWPGKDL